MAVRIEFPNGNNLIQYFPSASGDITQIFFAGYIKGLNYYEYIFHVRCNPIGTFIIDKAPDDNISTKIISGLFNAALTGGDSLQVSCDSSTIYINFLAFPVATTGVYLRIITFDY